MATSYNGWPASPDAGEIGIDSGFIGAGVKFPGGIKGGDVATVLGYVTDQLQARVEQVQVNPDGTGYGCWGYNYRANVNNPSTLSCHSSGTAIDWIAPSHPNGASGTFSNSQRATIYDILAECQGAIQWGGDYTGTKDEMHFEVICSAGYLADVAANLGGGSSIPPSPTPLPPLEGVTMPLIVKRENGAVDWAWSDDLSLLIRIPTEDYYRNLQYLGIVDVDHGAAETCETNIIEWLKGQVVGAGGTVFEPPQ